MVGMQQYTIIFCTDPFLLLLHISQVGSPTFASVEDNGVVANSLILNTN